VVGIFDVQVKRVRDADRDRVYEETLYAQGPQDATVIIAMTTGPFDDDMVDEIVGKFSEEGEIILVRSVLPLIVELCFFSIGVEISFR